MAGRTTLNISLSPSLGRFITSRVASGRYQSASEVVREGLRLLEQREQERLNDLAELRRAVAIGLDQADRGELVDGPRAIARIRERLRKLSARPERRRRAG